MNPSLSGDGDSCAGKLRGVAQFRNDILELKSDERSRATFDNRDSVARRSSGTFQ